MDPLVVSVTSTAAAFTAFGVIPSWNNMVSYFPNGRPPWAALPSLVSRRYAAAFFAFCDMSHMLNEDVEL